MFQSIKYKMLLQPCEGPLQITDLLQFTRKEHESRVHCLKTMRRLSAWKKTHGSDERVGAVFFSKAEGRLLKRQVRDAILIYRMDRQKRISVFRQYMDELKPAAQLCGVTR